VIAALPQVWLGLEIDQPIPDRIEYVMQSRDRVIFFLFSADHKDIPLAIVKFCRKPKENLPFQESVQRTIEIRQMLEGDEIKKTVPAMALLPQINGLAVAVEKALPGWSLDISVPERDKNVMVSASCQAFMDWLIRFQSHVRTGQLEVSSAWIEAKLIRRLGKAGIEEAYISKVERLTNKLIGIQMPLTWAYGDAHPSNLLLVDGKITGVIDWQGVSPDQWPVFDWFQFVLSLVQELTKIQYHNDKHKQIINECSFLLNKPSTTMGNILLKNTIDFFSNLKLDHNLISPMYLVFLIRYYSIGRKPALLKEILKQL
jgi:hypothetical protein